MTRIAPEAERAWRRRMAAPEGWAVPRPTTWTQALRVLLTGAAELTLEEAAAVLRLARTLESGGTRPPLDDEAVLRPALERILRSLEAGA